MFLSGVLLAVMSFVVFNLSSVYPVIPPCYFRERIALDTFYRATLC